MKKTRNFKSLNKFKIEKLKQERIKGGKVNEMHRDTN